MKTKKILALGLVLLSLGTTVYAQDEFKEDTTGKFLVINNERVKGWKELSSKWYYFNEDGYMVVNKWIGNYYLGSDGVMLTDTTTPDGYKVDKNGKWISERKATWKKNSKGWWYENSDGTYPASSWKEISSKWYYFNKDGYMVSNKWIGNYYLGSSGAMLTNTTTPDGYKVDATGKWIEERQAYEKKGTEVYDIEVDEIYETKLGNSGKFFKTFKEADKWVVTQIVDENSFYNKGGFNRYSINPVKYNGEIGYTVEFEKGELKFDWHKN